MIDAMQFARIKRASESLDYLEPQSAYRSVREETRWVSCDDVDALESNADALITGNRNALVEGYQSKLGPIDRVEITGDDNIIFFGPYSNINKADIIINGSNCLLYVGAFTSAGGFTIRMIGDNLRYIIGDHCMLAGRVTIGGPTARLRSRSTGLPKVSGDVLVGSHCWLAREVMILPETEIAHDTIVGQQAIVRGKFPAHVVLGGQPARVLTEDVTWGRRMDETLDAMRLSRHYKLTLTEPLAALKARIAAMDAGHV